MEVCSCEAGMGNTGAPGCLGSMKSIIMEFVVPTYDSTGAPNRIAKSQVMNQAWLDALINNTDQSKRLRPVSDLENVDEPLSEAVLETANSGRNSFVKDGVRSFNAEIWGSKNVAPARLGILKGMRCTDMSVYYLDLAGNFIGMEAETPDAYFYPIKVDKDTWNPRLGKATDATNQKILLSYAYDRNEKDERLAWIEPSEYTCNFTGSRGLLDIFIEFISATTTSLKVKMFMLYGTAKTKLPMTGLVSADFFDEVGGAPNKLFNITDSAAVTIVSVTEDPDGTYEFTFAAQGAADVIQVVPVKAGYDMTAVIEYLLNIIP